LGRLYKSKCINGEKEVMALKKDKPGRYDSIYAYAEKISKEYNIQNIWNGYETLDYQNDWYDTTALLESENPEEKKQGMKQWTEERRNMNRWIHKKREEKWAEDAAEAKLKKDNNINQLDPNHAKNINEEQPQKKEDKAEIDKYNEEELEVNVTKNKIQDEAKSTTFSLSVSESDDMVNRWCSYLVLWKEWFFDLHKMVKGTIILYGIDDYITVGTNILIPSKVLTSSKNFNYQDKFLENTYLLAHVESVKNSFSVSGGGARTYTTTIDFSRGIIVDAMSEISGYLKDGTYMLDYILKDPPGDRDFDNKVNVNTTTDSKIEGGTIGKIAKVFNKKDGNEEEA